jgi:SAM-dependent methyltransferase
MIGSIVSATLEGARLNSLLIAAMELRLAEHLAVGPASIAELASRAGISERGCQVVADGMVALRLWRVKDGVYENTSVAEGTLLPDAPGYVGEEHPALFRAWLPRFGRMTELVRSGQPPHAIDSPETLELWSLLTPVLARKGRSVPQQAIEALGLGSGTPHLLDVGGGGGGMYSLELLTANPQARSTQVDWPQINASARKRLEEAGVAERFTNLDGDFHDVDFGEGLYDVGVLSHIVHQESPVSTLEILRRIARALRPGGRIVVVDWVVDDGRTGPPSALFFNMTMLLLSAEGKSYERSELARLLREGGFSEPSFTQTKDMSVMLIADKS